MVEAANSGIRPHELVRMKHESPWICFQKDFELKLDVFSTIAIRKDFTRDLVIIKSFSGSDAPKKVHMLQRIRHNNFIAFLDYFMHKQTHYIVLEYIGISLAHFAKSSKYPTEIHLAAILGQILNGLAYLASKGLEHGSLSTSNILISSGGDVKITAQECCREVGSSRKLPDVRAVGYIAMELMQKYVKDDGAIGVENLDRWPSDSNAVDFLSRTTSASSVDELLKHPLFKCDWRKEDLKAMVEITAISASRAYKCLE
ncbi:kinase-like domain-containing protein [Hyaloscypha finlandica]|nr:kinase-like domain-containing protein [Hyaloscypha finlandica]